ncbi:unnamed protein product [Allacma fusca]|uniref:Uncharacterized protein n=1 Tax=Allacma fusca TaxID=39272 RepID=A0A8J2KS06_9HEXA|nr:unnamed protein product [Allacma fusca]
MRTGVTNLIRKDPVLAWQSSSSSDERKDFLVAAIGTLWKDELKPSTRALDHASRRRLKEDLKFEFDKTLWDMQSKLAASPDPAFSAAERAAGSAWFSPWIEDTSIVSIYCEKVQLRRVKGISDLKAGSVCIVGYVGKVLYNSLVYLAAGPFRVINIQDYGY